VPSQFKMKNMTSQEVYDIFLKEFTGNMLLNASTVRNEQARPFLFSFPSFLFLLFLPFLSFLK
jgi:hypothetical protein